MARLKITGYTEVDEADVDRQDKGGLTVDAWEALIGFGSSESDLANLAVSDLENVETSLED